MKTYFQQQEIKGRVYKNQEKSEIYIGSLDGNRYKSIKPQLLTDLVNLNQMDDSNLKDGLRSGSGDCEMKFTNEKNGDR